MPSGLLSYINTLLKKKEFVLSKQTLRSGTAIGALIREAEYAQSKADFISKLSIAIKETNEVLYWLELLFKTEYIDEKLFKSLQADAEELLKLLTSIINTTKKMLQKRINNYSLLTINYSLKHCLS